jgi:hypothetical protein
MPTPLERLGLSFNPFEPSGSGAPTGGTEPWIPDSWKNKLEKYFAQLHNSQGIKPLAVVGEYGSGKSYLLNWLDQHEFPRRRVQSYYFNDPGVQFYDLANQFLRRIGRKHFSKLVWELAEPYVKPRQYALFAGTYEEFLGSYRKKDKLKLEQQIQEAIIAAKVADDEEIANRFAQIVVDTPNKPYFEYRDFVPGTAKSVVAEREGANYFKALLRTLRLAGGVEKVAFLVDEFEEISLHRSITTAAAQDYRVTLKRLVDLTTTGELWLVLSLTHDGAKKTKQLDPAFWGRMFEFTVDPLSDGDALELVKSRLAAARPDKIKPKHEVFPFERDFLDRLQPVTRSIPRSIVKICSAAVSQAVEKKRVSISNGDVLAIEKELFPAVHGGER